MRGVFLCVALSGCVASSSVQCSDGLTCPETALCDEQHHLCISRSQLDSCNGQPDQADCPLPNEPGNCQQGVCLPIVCGNSRRDSGEMCDDGNVTANDGCSADCVSTEKCGNGFVDRAVLNNFETCDDGNHIEHDGCSSTCNLETVDWTQVDVAPRGRFSTGATYDAHLDRVVMFGGRTLSPSAPSPFLGDVWTWSGNWNRSANALGPEPRSRFGLAYDGNSRRTILYGGVGALGTLSDIWSWDGSSWTRLPDSPVATARNTFVMQYDEQRKRVVVFGGHDGVDTDLADTLEFDGTTWTKMSPLNHPSARSFASMTYDPDRGRIVLFGGQPFSTGVANNELWEYDGTTWTQRVASSPPPALDGAALGYDRVGHQLMLFGGGTDTVDATADTYLLGTSSGTWTKLSTGADPTTTRWEAALVDDGHGGLVLFGGRDDAGAEPTDTWRWDGVTWNLLTIPTLRSYSAIAYDPDHTRALLFGGLYDQTTLGDTWQLTLHGWESFPSTTPYEGAAMTYDAARGKFVRFGGAEGPSTPTLTSFTGIWTGAAWVDAAPGQPPGPRAYSNFVYDAKTRTSVLFGGLLETSPYVTDETWTWDGSTWTKQMPSVSPQARQKAAAGYDPIRKTVVVFGGSDLVNTFDDTWQWDGTSWTQLTMAVHPQGREDASFAWNPARQRLVLTGGLPFRLDAWEWDGSSWTELVTPTTAPQDQAGVTYPLLDGSGIGLVTGESRGQGTSQEYRQESWALSYKSAHASESCTAGDDVDGDALVGCADPDCWPVCAPECPPGVTGCP